MSTSRFQQLSDSAQQIEAGKLRALAVLGAQRVASLRRRADHRRGRLSGCAGRHVQRHFRPKATPPEVVAKLSAAIREALRKKAVIEQLARLGSEARGSTPEEFTAFLDQQTGNGPT